MTELIAVGSAPDKGLHYSSLMTMSAADARKTRENYIKSIEKTNHAADQPGNETAMALVLDFFEIQTSSSGDFIGARIDGIIAK